MSSFVQFPMQQLAFSKKTKAWRKQCVDFAESRSFFSYSPVRNSVKHKKINFDLLKGKLYMKDLMVIVNPENTKAGYIPDKITHYPIMNSKLNVLRGEEAKRIFDFKVVVTNPNAISEIETNKKEAVLQRLQQLIQNNSQSEEEFNSELEKMNDYFLYEWQDMREVRANCLLHHYIKEYNIPEKFNKGFMDAMAVGEEIYQCDIVGGEPVIEKLNTLKTHVFRSGYSNRIEDADMIILEDYWSPGKIIDTYYDVLSAKDIKAIEEYTNSPNEAATDSMDNIDERFGFINQNMVDDTISFDNMFGESLFGNTLDSPDLPYDLLGNIRVLRIYWKSRRKIKRVKSYDPTTGEEIYTFYPETYVCDTDAGEEETPFWINEAWEGTKIGSDIYVNMRPRVIQYNRLSSPSRCHFGIIGSVYNLNDDRPYTMVDMMKQYNYLYDTIHDRLNRLLARNWGIIMRLDLAKVPKGWDIDKWMYYAKAEGLAVEDSFKEGNIGQATGKLAGSLNNASNGVINAELGNSIQQYINLLEFIKLEMSEVAGISKQREGQIANRETVGGVERATLQSSHITEWLFVVHDDVKKRVLECFLETAKIAMRGRSKKFQYILSDGSQMVMEIDGDEFAEADYGLVVDNGQNLQELSQKLDMLAQAALQTQTLSFSTIMKLYSSASLAEKQRFIEKDEQAIMQRQQQAQQQQLQAQQQLADMELQQKQAELQAKDQMNMRDNETKILIANIQSEASLEDTEEPEVSEESKANLEEKIREFDERLKLDKDRLAFEKDKASKEQALKLKQINKTNKK